MKQILLYSLFIFGSLSGSSQILGGGTDFANAVLFNSAWLTGCPGGGTVFSNQKVFEPTDPIDPCAPAPACASGTAAADVWYSFIAQGPNATIVVNPSSGFDVAVQAFSGSTCPGLTEIACLDLFGNNQTETMFLIGLTVNTTYYFRVFGASNNNSNRTGTYTFCGSANLGSSVLPVTITRFNGSAANNKVNLLWTTSSESLNKHFVIEKSANGFVFTTIGTVNGSGFSNQAIDYSFIDATPYPTINYYRLKQVDIDGNFKYSAIVPVRMNVQAAAEVNVSPNPVVDKLNINIQSEVAAMAQIRIVNASGTPIYQSNKAVLKGSNMITITNTGYLSKGVYTLQVTVDNKQMSTRFVSNQ